jgi:hypothetical protein
VSLEKLSGKVTEQLDNVRSSLSSDMQLIASELRDSIAKKTARDEETHRSLCEKHETCISSIDSLTTEKEVAETKINSHLDQLAVDVKDLREITTNSFAQMQQRSDALNESETRLRERIETLEERLSKAEKDRIRSSEEVDEFGNINMDALSETKDAQLMMRIYQKNAERRLQQLEASSEILRQSVSEALGLQTHGVEWLITSALDKLKVVRPGSLMSPTFDAGGQRNLQMEFQFLWPDSDVEPSNLGHESGNCVISVWGNTGTKIAFRLNVGGVATGVLEHEFNDTEPYRSRRLWFFDEVVNEPDGGLRIGLELLESSWSVSAGAKLTMQSMEDPNSNRSGPFGRIMSRGNSARGSQEHQSGGSGDTVGNSAKAAPGLHLLREHMGGTGGDRSGGTSGGNHLAAQGSLTLSQRLNFRLPEVIQDEVTRMRSLTIKRVEWKIEHASTLRSCFTDGKCICSTPFAAIGIEGLSLVFYPTGYTGARADYCSLFLATPSSDVLDQTQLSLRIGRHKFDLETFPENSKLRGKLNVCRFDQGFDQHDDSVHIVLEVHANSSETLQLSAQQDAWRSISSQKRSLPKSNRRGTTPVGGRAPSAGACATGRKKASETLTSATAAAVRMQAASPCSERPASRMQPTPPSSDKPSSARMQTASPGAERPSGAPEVQSVSV